MRLTKVLSNIRDVDGFSFEVQTDEGRDVCMMNVYTTAEEKGKQRNEDPSNRPKGNKVARETIASGNTERKDKHINSSLLTLLLCFTVRGEQKGALVGLFRRDEARPLPRPYRSHLLARETTLGGRKVLGHDQHF